MAKKRGLPDFVKMRHDGHFVDEIASSSNPISIRMIKIQRIILNPHQPREELGNIDELAQSIREKGIIEPILVRKKDGKFEVIAGERRVRAAEKAGIDEIPAIEMDLEDDEALEYALVENIQRKELTPFEEAFAFKTLNQIFGYTQEEIAKRIGKSRSTVAETIRIATIPKNIVKLCKEAGIYSRSFLLELAKLENEEDMLKALKAYNEEGITRDDLREKRKNKKDVPKRFVFNFSAPDKSFKLKIQLKDREPSREELIQILESLLESIKKGEIEGLS